MPQIKLYSLGNWEGFNEIKLEKSKVFLDNLNDFLIEIGIGKITKREYEIEGKKYCKEAYWVLYNEDKEHNVIKSNIKDFGDGALYRVYNKDIELLIIFLQKSIKLVFYSNQKDRERIIKALMRFCKVTYKH